MASTREYGPETMGSTKGWKFLKQLCIYGILKR